MSTDTVADKLAELGHTLPAPMQLPAGMASLPMGMSVEIETEVYFE